MTRRCHQMEKKAKNFDKIVAEWKSKIDSLQVKSGVLFCQIDEDTVLCKCKVLLVLPSMNELLITFIDTG